MTLHTDEDNRLVAGRYRLAGKLGSGGMGVVWRAYDERLHRQVAIKQLRLPASLTADEAAQAKQKIMAEGRIAAKLQHPHAIMVYDVAEDGGEPFLVMEYLAAKSLADVLAERGTLPPEEAAAIGAAVADALAAAHSAGVVHRDIKPGNILIGEDGVKITDFGISRAVEDVTRTMTSMVVGTPAYLAPEVARGDRASFPSDVYSLGSTLYAAVEGQPPFGFADNAIALLYRVGAGEFPPPKRAGRLTDVLMALLRTDPNQRPTMAEASIALAAASTDRRPETLPVPVPEQETRRISPSRSTAVLPAGDDDSTETAAPAAAPAPLPSPRRAGDRRRRTVGLAAAITALLAIGGVILLAAVNREAGRGTVAATQPTSQPSTPASTVPPSTVPTSAPPTSQAVPPPPAQPSAAQPPSAAPPPAGNAGSPQAALIDYYALMPGNLEEAWTRLTPKYQVSPAGGFSGYQRWWSQIGRVQISDVTPISGGRVEATIVYYFKDGRVVRERHSYNLILDKDQWLIDTSRVLSSVTL